MGAYADAYTSTSYRRTQNPRIAKSFWQITGSVKDPQKNIYRNPKLCLEIDATLLSFHNFSIKSLWGVGFECVSRWHCIGTVTLLSCILFNLFAKSYFKQLSVLFGLVVGYILAVCMHQVDFSALANTSIIAFPHIMPFKMEFNLNAIVSVTLIFLVSATETIGDTSALASSGLNRDVTVKETTGSIACDGFVSALSACFGCLPITSFSQNVGLVAMTKVVNRFAIATGAVIMILAGIFPIFGAVLATLPDSVLGGCTIMMFGTIVVSGIQMIGKCGFTQRNITIAALSLSVGIGFTQVPEIFAIFPQIVQNVFAQNCVAVVFLVAVILNLVLPKNMEAKV